VANGTADDVEINARALGFGDGACARVHVPDVVWYSGFAGN
jgi:hypothetical protein